MVTSSRAAIGQSESKSNDGNETEILVVNWNQNCGCLTVGTSKGFQVHNCDAFKEVLGRELPGTGGFRIVEMLFHSDILALVCGGINPQYPSSKVMIWSDSKRRFIGELRFRSSVRGVKLRQDGIVVAVEHKIYVYNLVDLNLVHQISTGSNPKGLCCISHRSNNWVLACPGAIWGEVRVEHFGSKVVKLINAHHSEIACMNLTLDGLLLATASTNGTLIRIFNTTDGTQLQELRRGLERAAIYSISFSANLQWLVVSSDKGTVHVFSLQVRISGEAASNRLVSAQGSESKRLMSTSADAHSPSRTGANISSSLYFIRGFLPKYFSSEWSFAQFHLPAHTRCIAAFGAQNTVMIAGMDGCFYRCTFDPRRGGQMTQVDHRQFVKSSPASARATAS